MHLLLRVEGLQSDLDHLIPASSKAVLIEQSLENLGVEILHLDNPIAVGHRISDNHDAGSVGRLFKWVIEAPPAVLVDIEADALPDP